MIDKLKGDITVNNSNPSNFLSKVGRHYRLAAGVRPAAGFARSFPVEAMKKSKIGFFN